MIISLVRFFKIILFQCIIVSSMMSCSADTVLNSDTGVSTYEERIEDQRPTAGTTSTTAKPQLATASPSVITTPASTSLDIWPGFIAFPDEVGGTESKEYRDIVHEKYIESVLVKVTPKARKYVHETYRKLFDFLWKIKDQISVDMPQGGYFKKNTPPLDTYQTAFSRDGKGVRKCPYLPIYVFQEVRSDGSMLDSEPVILFKDGKGYSLGGYIQTTDAPVRFTFDPVSKSLLNLNSSYGRITAQYKDSLVSDRYTKTCDKNSCYMDTCMIEYFNNNYFK